MKCIFLFAICCLSQICLSQNLIPNPSFEAANTCYKYNEKCSPKGWRSTTLKGFRYNEYLGDRHRVKPPDGDRYVALIMYNEARANDRKFIQAPLLCPLIKGKAYRLQLYFKTQSKVVHQFAVYFPETLRILKNNLPLLEVEPQIVLSCDENMDVNTWQKLEAEFVASGKEQGIIIGNFFKDEQTQVSLLKKLTRKQLKDNPPRSIIYYSFDQISLFTQDSLEQDCPLLENQAFLYRDTTRHILSEKVLSLADIPKVVVEEKMIKDTFIQIPKQPAVEKPSPPIEIPIESAFVLDNVLFENNSAKLLPVAYSSLEKIVAALQAKSDYRLRIIGHTDNIGKQADNLRLSQQRAQSVAQFLEDRGIEASRLEVNGQGETVPIADNNTAQGRQQNRRVEFFILK